MQLNVIKCHALFYRHNNRQKSEYSGQGGNVIAESGTVHDLRDHMNNVETFHVPIAKVTRVYASSSGIFRPRNSQALLLLWRTLILNHLDYCSQIWFPKSVS